MRVTEPFSVLPNVATLIKSQFLSVLFSRFEGWLADPHLGNPRTRTFDKSPGQSHQTSRRPEPGYK